MRTRIYLTSALFLTLIAVTSCKKDKKEETVTPTMFNKPLSADINGVTVDALISYGQLSPDGILISGSSSQKIIALNIPLNFSAGSSYVLDSVGTTLSYSTDNYLTHYRSVNGTLTIQSFNPDVNRVQGIFHGTVVRAPGDTIIVTNGEFNTTY